MYSKKLGLLKSVNEKDIFVRTSVETRTMHVASGLITGFDKSFQTKTFPTTTQPSPVSISFASVHLLRAVEICLDRSTLYPQITPAPTQTMFGTHTSLSLRGRTTCRPMLI